jgi:hypothetical protein
MRRREFITVVGGALAWPLGGRAQPIEKIHRVGVVFTTPPISQLVGPDPINPPARAFVHRLLELGYVDGKNLALEMRTAEGRFERFPEIMRELVSIQNRHHCRYYESNGSGC